jgi:cytoskeletal protein CcmA (bactofilin family)
MEQRAIGWVRKQIGAGDARPATKPARGQGPAGVVRTFVGQGADFEGTLRLRDAFRIDGEFRGEIVSQTSVIVGAAAGIEANIRAREVIIAGAVVGNVAASRQLTIRSGGRLTGDVETPCLEIAKGAILNGRTTMVRPEVTARHDATARHDVTARAEARPPHRDEPPRPGAASPTQLAEQPRSFPDTSPR